MPTDLFATNIVLNRKGASLSEVGASRSVPPTAAGPKEDTSVFEVFFRRANQQIHIKVFAMFKGAAFHPLKVDKDLDNFPSAEQKHGT